MKREELEHLVRASARICEEPIFVIVGSQAILGTYPEVSEEALIRSIEADLYPLYDPAKSVLLEAIGWGSQFHETHGYYADGVDQNTAVLPEGWYDRVASVSVETDHKAHVTALCIEPHDVAISKLVAERDKDLEYVRAALSAGYIRVEILLERLGLTRQLNRARRERIAGLIERMTTAASDVP